MCYTLFFDGKFQLNQPLTPAQRAYLTQFSKTRRMSRNSALVANLPDPLRQAVDLPVGEEGEYYVSGEDVHQYDKSTDETVVDCDRPPKTQPGLHCYWIPNEDGTAIVWNLIDGFKNYIEWIRYLIQHFLAPWGRVLNGEVKWTGLFKEDKSLDTGVIKIKDNVVTVEYKG